MELRQVPDKLRFEGAGECAGIKIEFDRTAGFSMPSNHYHRDYEFYYLFTGLRHYFIDDRTYAVEAGDLVLIGSDIVHRTANADSTGGHDYERLLLYFDPSYFDRFSDEHRDLLLSVFRSLPVVRLKLQRRLQLEALLLRLLAELTEQQPGYTLHASNAVNEALLFAARELLREEPPAPAAPSPAEQRITSVVRYINAHYSDNLQLERLSSLFYTSPSHLSRSFRQTTGFGLSEYITLTRIRQAQRLLQESHLSITEIAERSGFGNFSHFGKCFKQIAGLSPRDYRRQLAERGNGA